MTADVRRVLADLDAAHQAATPGPWHVMRSNDERRAYAITAGRIVTDSAGCSVADAAAIVAEHDALPALTSALRQLADLADELDGDASSGDWLVSAQIADRIRAALSPLAAPDSSRSGQ